MTSWKLPLAAFAMLLLWLIVILGVKPDPRQTVEQLLPPDMLAKSRLLEQAFGLEKGMKLVYLSASLQGDISRDFQINSHRDRRQGDSLCLTKVVNEESWRPCPEQGIENRPVLILVPESGDELATGASGRHKERIGARPLSQRIKQPDTIIVTGTSRLRDASWQAARDTILYSAAWLTLTLLLLPVLLYRSVRAMLFILLNATTSTLLLLLLIGTPHALHLLVIPVIWAIATLDACHLLERSILLRQAGEPRPTITAIRQLLKPCGATTLTTVAGFLAFALPESSPLLREFGLYAATGTLIAFAVTFLLAWLMPSGLMTGKASASPLPATGPATRLVRASAKHRVKILVFWGALLVVSLALSTRLETATPYPHVFADRTAEAQTLHKLEETLDTDLKPLHIFIEPVDDRGLDSKQLVSSFLALSDYLAKLPESRLVLPLDLLRGTDKLPDAVPETDTGWIDTELGIARTLVMLKPVDQARMSEILSWIRHFDQTMLSHYRIHFSGPAYQYHMVEKLGQRGAAEGALLSLGAVFLVLILAFGKTIPALLATATTLLPLALVCGLMVLLEIPWTLALLTVPAVLFGLAVDDAIHLLWPDNSHQRGELIAANAKRSATALISTTLIIALSLASLLPSPLEANRQLAILLPAGLLTALLTALTLLPALLSFSQRR